MGQLICKSDNTVDETCVKKCKQLDYESLEELDAIKSLSHGFHRQE